MKTWLMLSLTAAGMFGAGVFAAPELSRGPADPGMQASYHHKWPTALDPATMTAMPQPKLADGSVASLRGLRGSLPTADLVMVTEAAAPAAGIPLRCRVDC
jgi:hypothetical protein